MHVPYISDNCFYNNKLSQESLFQFQSDAIRKAAETHSCVFVGRCADYVLRDFNDMVSVFITANLDERIKRICKRHNCNEEEAKRLLKAKKTAARHTTTTIQVKHGDTAHLTTCV